jgi:hypothetical protein
MQRLLILFLAVFLPVAGLSQSVPIVDAGYLTNVQGESNFIKNPNAQKNVANVTTDSDGSVITRSTTTPLSATSEFNLTDGDAWSAVFAARTFDSGMNGRQCEARVTVRGVAGTATLAVYDGTTLIGSVDVVPNATTSVVPTVYFPCGAPTTPKLKLSGSTAVTGTLEFGAAYMGPAFSTSAGTISTEWTTYTAASFGGQGTLTITQTELKWRRVGPDIYVRGSLAIGAGTGASGTFSVPLPTGLVTTAITKNAGGGNWVDFSESKSIQLVSEITNGTGTIYFIKTPDTGSFGVLQGADLSTTDALTFTAGPYPISGWAATDIVTPEASLGSIVNASRASSASIPDSATATEIIFDAERSDTNDEYSPSTGRFTAKSPGWFQFNYGISTAPVSTNPSPVISRLRINGSGTEYGINETYDFVASKYRTIGGTATLYLTAGQYVSVWLSSLGAAMQIDYSSSEYTYFNVKRVNAPGNQSFYISSPLKAAPDGTGVKVKSSTNVDIVTLDDTGAEITQNTSSAFGARYSFNSTSTNGRKWSLGSNFLVGNGEFGLYNATNAVTAWSVSPTGASTFGPASGLTAAHIMQNSSVSANDSVLRLIKQANTAGSNNTLYQEFYGNNGSDGNIGNNGSAVLTLTDSSDVRKKENIREATYGISTIKALHPVEFDWKFGVKNVKGFIGQELKNVLPESVTIKDESKNGGYADAHYIETQTMIPVLVKGIQQQQAQIECLVKADNKKQRQACVGVK